jgi:hypothetical protein
VAALVLALAPVTQADVFGVDNVNGMAQNPYPGAGAGGDVFYNAVTRQPCGVDDRLREDGWGIFKIETITNAATSGTVWSEFINNAEGMEIYGIYYGRLDTKVVNSISGFGLVVIESQNVRFAIFANPIGTFDGVGGVAQGSAGRTGFDQYTGITDGTLLLSGVVDALDSKASFAYDFTVDKEGNSDNSRWSSTMALTGGEWLDRFGDYLLLADNLVPFEASDETGNWVMRGGGSMVGVMDGIGVAISMNTWDMTTVYTDGHAPEPMTMSLLAVGGVALLRRRK